MKNPLDELTTKEKIIRVTMDIIAEEGFHNTTVRKIAARAGVNVAAISYHFGSKDAVINEALRAVTDQLKDTFKLLQTNNSNPEDRLVVFVNNYTNIMFKYPDVIKNMIDHTIHNKLLDEQVEYVAFLKAEGTKLIKQTIEQIRPDLDDCSLYLKTLHLISSLSFPFLMGERVQEVLGVDLAQPEIRQMYTSTLLEDVCCRN